jgi:hypothetical protein
LPEIESGYRFMSKVYELKAIAPRIVQKTLRELIFRTTLRKCYLVGLQKSTKKLNPHSFHILDCFVIWPVAAIIRIQKLTGVNYSNVMLLVAKTVNLGDSLKSLLFLHLSWKIWNARFKWIKSLFSWGSRKNHLNFRFFLKFYKYYEENNEKIEFKPSYGNI